MYIEIVKEWMLESFGTKADEVIQCNINNIVSKLDNAELATLSLAIMLADLKARNYRS